MNSYLSMSSVPQSHLNRVTFADGYNTSASPLDTHAELTSPTKRSDRKSLGILKYNDDRRKRERGHDDEYGDIAKKTRLEGDEFIDGDEEAGWQDSNHSQNSSMPRGSKRGLGEDDDSDLETSKGERGKRQRKVSGDKESTFRRDMDVDAEGEDLLGDLKSLSRGKKRDRDETGSSYGGELEQEDDEANFDVEGEKARRRKRRNKRRSDANSSSRGKKRDRDLEDETGESDDGTGVAFHRMFRKKRGKRTSDEEKLSDVSMEDSSSISTKGKKIGETWSSNGVQYKIGPNGQRLRFELVKKARQKFVMPIDSVHPDRKANLEVYVEAWLSEEEYREAKTQHILSWQESPKGSTEPETPPPSTPDTLSTPPHTGKHLLWDSTMGIPSSQPHDNPFETAKSPTPQLTITGNAAASKRIASAVRNSSDNKLPGNSNIASPSPSLMDSTNMRSPRTYKQFSKWEKQDLEAKAMMRMREINRKKEEEKEKEKVASALPTVPKITFTPPVADARSTTKPPAFSLPGASTAPKLSFNAPATSSPLANGDNKPEAAKPPPSTMPSFSFGNPGSAPAPAPASAQATTAAPTAQTNPMAPANPPAFSFGPTPGATHTAPADKPKPTLGLGLPSSGPSAPQPASLAATPSTVPPLSTPVPPKFSFNVPPKPAAVPSSSTEQNKDVPASSGASSVGGSLLTRLGGSAPTAQNNATPSTTPPSFSFAKPAAPASSKTASSSSPFGSAFSAAPSSSPFSGASSTPATAPQQPSQPTNGPSSSSVVPVKFNFFGGATKAPSPSPFGNTASNTSTMTTSATPSSLSGALNPVPPSSTTTAKPTSSPFGSTNNNPTDGGSTASTTPVLKFSFGAPAASSSGATANAGSTGQQSTPQPAPSATSSPFGNSSAFGGSSPFGSSASASNSTNNNNTSKSAFGSNTSGTNAFGAPSTPSPFGAASTGNNIFGGGNNTFGAKPTNFETKPASTSAFSTPSETQSSGTFGTKPTNFDIKPVSTSAFSKPSETQSFGTAPAAKSAFAFGSPAPASSSAVPGSTPFGFGASSNGFGTAAAAKPAGEAPTKSAFSFGSSSPATPGASNSTPASEPPKSAFAFGNTTTPAGSPANSVLSFGAAAPSSTSNATGGPLFSFGGMSAGGQSVFGGSGSSAPTAFSAFANKPAGSNTAK
ncbi:hypothetical protein J3R30DRAFT_2719755 [Lentinula aciculospora]|uniref:Uncharacterized protein n=1 Tax=Lentinula aciculospora TaxID=153920 RepID=A0A9W9ABN3_9AGAR|nr:hypothetical protein J3R30DRAFT_2719755 [Lentinula aciculospora]